MLGSTAFRAMRLPTATSTISARAFSSTPRASLARMSLVGRLAAQPEEVTVRDEQSLVRFAVGTQYGRGDTQKTSWFKVASFATGGAKDYLLRLPKGTLLFVDADARMEAYDDKDGNRRTSLGLIARNFEVVARGREAGSEEEVGRGDEGLVEERA